MGLPPMVIIIRTFIDANDPADIKAANLGLDEKALPIGKTIAIPEK